MIAAYEVADLFLWQRIGPAYRTAPVRLQATSDERVVTVDGVDFEVVEVGLADESDINKGVIHKLPTGPGATGFGLSHACTKMKATPEEAATSDRGLTTSTTRFKSKKEGL